MVIIRVHGMIFLFPSVTYNFPFTSDLSGGVGEESSDKFGSILAVLSSVTQGLFFSLIGYKYAKGENVTNMDVLCYNVVASFGCCVGKSVGWSDTHREK